MDGKAWRGDIKSAGREQGKDYERGGRKRDVRDVLLSEGEKRDRAGKQSGESERARVKEREREREEIAAASPAG